MKIIDITAIGSANIYTWDKDYLFKVLSTGKEPVLKDPKLIAAFRRIDRKDFVPQVLKAKAYVDQDLDLGFGELMTRPTVTAQMLELLKPKLGGKYLDIGTGTGYLAMLLGFAIGPTGKVITMERVQWLWEMARHSSTFYKDISNISFLYRDGTNGLVDYAPFDGIHISFILNPIPDTLKMQLSPEGGRLVVPGSNNDIRVIERNGDSFVEEIIPGFVFKEGKVGVA